MMTTARRLETPWWAAIGAPLIGVPLMVGMLALVAPETPVAADEEVAVHAVHVAPADCEVERAPEEAEAAWRS